MTRQDIPGFLLERFPERGTLSYEDFTQPGEGDRGWAEHSIARYAYDGDMYADGSMELEVHAFNVISRPWPEIDWFEIGVDGWMVPGFLNRRSFIHAFPSLLGCLHALRRMDLDFDSLSGAEREKFGKCSDLLANFIGRLDLNRLKELEDEIGDEGTFDWVREFYASLDEDIKKYVSGILEGFTFYDLEAGGALNSYWHQWTE